MIRPSSMASVVTAQLSSAMVWLSMWLEPRLGTIFGQLRFDDNNGWSQSPAGP